MTKKIVALLLALVLVFAMTACAKTETPAADAPAAASCRLTSGPVSSVPAARGRRSQEVEREMG